MEQRLDVDPASTDGLANRRQRIMPGGMREYRLLIGDFVVCAALAGAGADHRSLLDRAEARQREELTGLAPCPEAIPLRQIVSVDEVAEDLLDHLADGDVDMQLADLGV